MEAQQAAAEQAMESLLGGAAGTASEVLSAGNNELSNALGSISAVDPNASLVGLSNNEAVRRANSAVDLSLWHSDLQLSLPFLSIS